MSQVDREDGEEKRRMSKGKWKISCFPGHPILLYNFLTGSIQDNAFLPTDKHSSSFIQMIFCNGGMNFFKNGLKSQTKSIFDLKNLRGIIICRKKIWLTSVTTLASEHD